MDYFSVFIQMLQAKGLTDNTIRAYKTYIMPYLTYLSNLSIPPEEASWQVMRDFLSWIQKERSLSDRTVNMAISHLQFFHVYVLHKEWDKTQIPFRKFDTYLPFVPTRQVVSGFIQSIDDPKAKAAVSILYGTGLRLDELCHLRCADIRRSTRQIYVCHSKNHSDRLIPLSPATWETILAYWCGCPSGRRPREWLFTQQRSLDTPMDKQWLQSLILRQRTALGLDGRLTAHSFRHAYATHSYENGMDLLTLKARLGHKSLNSTVIYVQLAANQDPRVVNPLDQIGGGRVG